MEVAPSSWGGCCLNLFNNAFYAVRQRAVLADQAYTPTVWVSTQRTDGKVEIEVRDNGTGMPPEVAEKIFQPFFTTKPTGEGTGLGLSLSYDIVTKGHGGVVAGGVVRGGGDGVFGDTTHKTLIMTPVKKALFLLVLITLPYFGLAQQIQFRIDSLKKELLKPQADTTRVWTLYFLSQLYAVCQLDSSISYSHKTLDLAKAVNFNEGIQWGKFRVASSLSERNIPRSMAMFYEILKQNQGSDSNMKEREVDCNYMIGMLYSYLRNAKQAVYHLKLARKMELQHKPRKELIASCDRETGGAFLFSNQSDSARFYLSRAVKENPGLSQSPTYLFYRGGAEIERDPALALQYLRKSFQLAHQSDDLRILSFSCRRLSDFYLTHTSHLDSAIYVAKIGLQAAQTMTLHRGIYYNGLVLAESYKRLHVIDSANKYQTLMLAIRDSIFGIEKFNEIQTTVIEEQQRIQTLEDEKSRIKVFGLTALLAGLFIIAGILYQNNRQKQNANALLQKLNAEVISQKEEIEAQRDNLEQTLDILQSTQTQLIQKEKLASLGELTAGIAHEIQNPLNFVNNYSEVNVELIEELQEEVEKDNKEEVKAILADLRDNERKIHHHGRRADAIVRGMLEHARATPGEQGSPPT